MSKQPTKAKATPEAGAEEVQQVQQEAAPEITLQDLQLMKNLIDVTSTRGAFKPAEMTAVGTLYSKLDKFLAAVAEQQKVAEGE